MINNSLRLKWLDINKDEKEIHAWRVFIMEQKGVLNKEFCSESEADDEGDRVEPMEGEENVY